VTLEREAGMLEEFCEGEVVETARPLMLHCSVSDPGG
jgi:hypothetical protein